jgi:hypothetical protein
MLHHDHLLQVELETTPRPWRGAVVVAADGGWSSRRALEQASREADLRGVGLIIVTVRGTPLVEPTGYSAWARADLEAADHASCVNHCCPGSRATSPGSCGSRPPASPVVGSSSRAGSGHLSRTRPA